MLFTNLRVKVAWKRATFFNFRRISERTCIDQDFKKERKILLPIITQKVTLDLSGFFPAEFIKAKQGDEKSRYLECSFTDRKQPFSIPEGVTPRLLMEKRDGHQILVDGIVEEGRAVFEFSQQMLAVAGIARCEVQLYEKDSLLSSAIFYLSVFPSVFDQDKIESTDEYQSLVKALEQTEQMQTHMSDEDRHITEERKRWIDKIPEIESAPPNPHNHIPDEVSGLNQILAQKAENIHQHTIPQIGDLQEVLDTKASKQDIAINSDVYLSLKAYGAVGDGVADDTQALKDGISAAIEAGKILYLDRGTYRITDRILITKPLMIIGASNTESVIQFEGEDYPEETPYDPVNYEESHGVFCLQDNNTTLWNFAIQGGTSTSNASNWNGIIFHYPKISEAGKSFYASAERVNLQQLNIRGFRNGVLIYGGWNRYILTCHFLDCSEAGIQYKVLERDTVGNWSASGDIIQSSQFIGNTVGYLAECNFESTIQNCVFEYNDRGILLNNCKDVIFRNCWNEANRNNMLVKGSARFEGGYNINQNNVDHELLSGNDTLKFDFEEQNLITQAGVVKFKQLAGVIVRGVDLGASTINMILNSYFSTFDGWNTEVYGSVREDSELQYNKHNTLLVDITNRDDPTDPNFGAHTDKIECRPDTAYNAGVLIHTADRSMIDHKAYLQAEFYNRDQVCIDTKRIDITPVADNVWEDHSMTFTTSSDCFFIVIKLYLGRNGIVHFAEPMLSEQDITRNDVTLLKKDEQTLQVISSVGDVIGTIAMQPAS